VGFRFRKSLRIVPGIRLNLSKSGPSLSLGGKGFHYNIGAKGSRVTVGVPGTGLSWSQYTSHSKPRPAQFERDSAPVLPLVQSQFPAEPVLTPIASDPADKLNTLSTSELAPILDKAHRRWRFAPLVLVLCLCTFLGAFIFNNGTLIGLTALYTTIVVPIAVYLDRYRRSVKIKYKLEGIAEKVSAAIADSFSDLANCTFVWRVSARGHTTDWKRNAGATTLTQRNKILLRESRPSCSRGSVRFPAIKLGKEEIFFLPDAILVADANSVAALNYKDFTLSASKTRFIESESVPRDATVIGETWQYVSKNGGPDRRFKFNRRLPVCLYGEMRIESSTGLNGLIHLSNPAAADRFGKIINILNENTLTESDHKSISSIIKPKAWPSILLGGVLFLYTLFALIVVQPSARVADSSPNIPTKIEQIQEHPRERAIPSKQESKPQPQNKKAVGKPMVITPQ
jgi:uncharacterized protein DUF4236